MDALIHGAFAGLVATIVMDAWASVAKLALRWPTANWGMVGRWFGHMPQGKFSHRAIAEAPPVRGELPIGWTAHYAIGIAYGIAFVQLHQLVSNARPGITDALLFSWVLLVFPWLVMQPAMGAGVFSSRAPHPALARIVSVSMHTAFGIGLYLGSRLLAAA
jgi:hypothetical protein